MKQKNKARKIISAKITAQLILPLLEKYYRAKFLGLEHIPDTPFLGVGNHLGVHFCTRGLFVARQVSYNE